MELPGCSSSAAGDYTWSGPLASPATAERQQELFGAIRKQPWQPVQRRPVQQRSEDCVGRSMPDRDQRHACVAKLQKSTSLREEDIRRLQLQQQKRREEEDLTAAVEEEMEEMGQSLTWITLDQ